MEVPALHGGLPRLRRVGRRQRRPRHRLAARAGRPRRHDRRLLLRPGLLPRRPRLVRQAVHVRGVDPDAVRPVLPAGRRGRARRSTGSSPTSTSRATLLDAAGVDVPARMQGRSFWARPHGSGCGRSAIGTTEGFYYRYWMHDDSSHQVGAHYGYRTHRYTLIFFYNDGLGLPGCSDRRFAQEWELYDLEADPEELRQRRRRPGLRAGARRARGADVAGAEGGRRRAPSRPARPPPRRRGPRPRLTRARPRRGPRAGTRARAW